MAIGFPKPRPRLLVKAAARLKREKAARDLRKAVRARDGSQCQCCHIPVFVSAANPLQRAQVHHMRFKSKGGTDEMSNLVTVCAECHAKIHAHEIEVRGTHAMKVRFVLTALRQAAKLRIRSKGRDV